jgi:RND family efflux transporter MFP subunit
MEQNRADKEQGDSMSGDGKGADLRDLDPERSFWAKFAEATTPKAFCQSWLPLQCRMLKGVRCAMVLLGNADHGPYAPVAVWPDAKLGMNHLAGTAEKALRERRGLLVDGKSEAGGQAISPETIQVAYPIEVAQKIHGVVVLEIDQTSRQEVQGLMRQLHWGGAWLEVLIRRTEVVRTEEQNERLRKIMDLIVSAFENDDYQSSAMAFATKLSTLFGCDRVSLGWLKKGHARVSVLSHSAEFGQEMNLMRAIGRAMDEAIDQQSVMIYPPDPPDTPLVVRSHEELSRQHGAGAILTIPLAHKGRFFGGLTLERPPKNPFDAETAEICETAAALAGPVLDIKQAEERWVVLKLSDAVAGQLKGLFGPGYLGRKMVAALFVGLLLFFSVFKTDYRVTATSIIEGDVKRAIAAPFNGYVKDAPIRAGDTVQEGQVIALLDDRDLILERFKWMTEKEQFAKQYHEAMAKHERSQILIAKAKMDQAEAQISLLDEQLSRTQLTAPFDAVVMSGDLSQSLGAPVERGQVLFEVAPLDAYRVIIEVDERDIADIAVGQKSELIFPSLPGESFPFTVGKITPVTTAKEGRNTFRVEGRIEKVSQRLRPGMEGVGKITVDRRRLIWIWTHKAADWVRLKVWRWMP